METETSQAVLEERVLTGRVRRNVSEREVVFCGYCQKELNPENAYKSPGGYPYCSSEHFHLFTED